MPLTTLTMRQGQTAQQKRAMLDAIHAALVEAFGIPTNDRFQVINEIAPDNWDVAQSVDEIIVEIKAFSGRSVDAKRTLYKALVHNMEQIGIVPTDVFIIVNDLPMENWGIRGGQAACDVDFSFKIDI